MWAGDKGKLYGSRSKGLGDRRRTNWTSNGGITGRCERATSLERAFIKGKLQGGTVRRIDTNSGILYTRKLVSISGALLSLFTEESRFKIMSLT